MWSKSTAALGGLAFVATTMLGACASNSGDGAGGNDDRLSMTFVNPLPSYPSWRTVGDCIQKRADEQNVDFNETGPSGQAMDPTAQTKLVQQAVTARKDAIITFPSSEGFSALMEQAQKKDITTATIYGTGGKGSGADVNVGADFAKVGQIYVESIAERPGPQKIGLIAASNTGIGKIWMDGIKDVAAKTDTVEVVGEVYTGDDSSKALAQANALLTAHPDITVIATHMGTVTQGAISAIKSKGRTGVVAFYGNGPDNGGKEAMAAGTMDKMLVQDLCGIGKEIVSQVVKFRGGDKSADFVDITFTMSGKDDYQSYLDKGWG